MRYAVIYGSAANAKIDVNDSSQIIDKSSFSEKFRNAGNICSNL
jgi:hypothetical protein